MFVTQFENQLQSCSQKYSLQLGVVFFLLPGQKNFQLIPDNLLYGARIVMENSNFYFGSYTGPTKTTLKVKTF